jgi:predicted acyl esterase
MMSLKIGTASAMCALVVAGLGSVATAEDALPRREDVMASMRDGVRLATTVYFPTSGDPAPAILIRTPYNKNSVRGMVKGFVDFGYVIVTQDCRGRFGSEGEYVPFQDDARDGYDAVEWTAAQPWCNGKVGMWGGSALGITTNMAATALPPHLVCGYVVVAPTSWRDEALYMGGVWRKSLIDGWMAAQGATEVRIDWSRRPIMDPYWEPMEIYLHHDKMRIPIYNVGGWFDIFQKGSIENFLGLQARGAQGARGNQKLLMAAIGHGPLGSRFKNFPNEGGDTRPDDARRWFDYWLQGIDTGIMDEPPIRYFLMGDAETPDAPGNVWIETETWPPESLPTSYYLLEDGTLATQPPASGSESKTAYRCDPAHPVKTIGGQNLVIPKGPMDQREVGERADYFRFHTEPLTEPVTVIGPLEVQLWVETDAPDTDFMAKLVDVYPDGYEALLADSALRLRYRKGPDQEIMMTPGGVEKIELDLWYTAYVFNRGHRIGVHVAGSNDPRFDPNPNTGKPLRSDDETRVAVNAFHHDADHPSRIILPVVGNEIWAAIE